MATEPGFLPEDTTIVPIFLTINVRKRPAHPSTDKVKLIVVEEVKKAVEKHYRDSKGLTDLGTIQLANIHGVTAYVQVSSEREGFEHHVFTADNLLGIYQQEDEYQKVAEWIALARPGAFLKVRDDMIFAVTDGSEVVRVTKPVIETRKLL